MAAVSLPLDSGHGVLLVIFLVVLVAPRIGRLVRLPDLVGLIVGGIVVGPHVLGLIERSGTVEALGTAGLLYLMFQAGLELDPDDFTAHRKTAAVFGGLTFLFPLAIGTVVHLTLDFSVVAALLLGSCWASHTLLVYPMFQDASAVSNRAVSIGVAGTVLTDTAALLVLVGLAKAHEGELTAISLAIQIPAMVAAATLVLRGLPTLTRWFFAGIGRDRSARFLFVLVALYGAALLAESVGVEPIIGAFLAGLAINRNVIDGSDVDDRIRQFGSVLLIPLFLVSVGMLIDPVAAFTNGRTLVLAGAFTFVVVVTKTLAAAVTARIYGLDNAERLALMSLSIPQAAATLAAVFVGFDIRVLEQETVDAVVLVILVTCLLGTVVASRAIAELPAAPVRVTPPGRRIVVSVDPDNVDESIVELAAALGRSDGGTVYPLSVLDVASSHGEVQALRRSLVATAERTAMTNGCEARSVVRLDLTPAIGLVHGAIEHDATMIVVPWDGSRTGEGDRFSHTADTLLDLATTPIVVARIAEFRRYRRVVLRLDAEDLAADLKTAELVWLIGTRLSTHLKTPLVLATNADDQLLANTPGITGHVDLVERLVGPSSTSTSSVDGSRDLVVRPLGHQATAHQAATSSTLWVALPRAGR